MRLIVLGASGQTGQCIVQQALDQGHSVTAIVRTPEKVSIEHENLSVVKGDVFSEQDLVEKFKDHDAVLSALGFSRNSNPVTGYTESMRNIVAAMRANNIKRLVVMAAHFTDIKSAEGRGFFINWILIPFIKRVLINMNEMEQWLEKEASDLDWTVVRPGGLANDPLTEDQVVGEVGAQFVADPSVYTRIPRANVAQYMLSLLEDGVDQLIRKVVAIAVKP